MTFHPRVAAPLTCDQARTLRRAVLFVFPPQGLHLGGRIARVRRDLHRGLPQMVRCDRYLVNSPLGGGKRARCRTLHVRQHREGHQQTCIPQHRRSRHDLLDRMLAHLQERFKISKSLNTCSEEKAWARKVFPTGCRLVTYYRQLSCESCTSSAMLRPSRTACRLVTCSQEMISRYCSVPPLPAVRITQAHRKALARPRSVHARHFASYR